MVLSYYNLRPLKMLKKIMDQMLLNTVRKSSLFQILDATAPGSQRIKDITFWITHILS